MTPHFGLLPAVFGSTFKVACESPVAMGDSPGFHNRSNAGGPEVNSNSRTGASCFIRECMLHGHVFEVSGPFFPDVIALPSELLQF